jgi:hypothetical protein
MYDEGIYRLEHHRGPQEVFTGRRAEQSQRYLDVQRFGRRQENATGKIKKLLGVDRTAWCTTLWEPH